MSTIHLIWLLDYFLKKAVIHMKFVAGVVMISAVAGVVWAQSGNNVDLSAPTSTIETFVKAYNNRNIEQMQKCVLNPNPSAKAGQFLQKNKLNLQFNVTEYSGVTLLNDSASVVVSLTISADGAAVSQKELVLLKRTNNEWKIDSDATVRLAFDPKKPDAELPKYMLGAMATISAGNEQFLQEVETSIERAETDACLRELRILSLCVGMYEQDHDQNLPPFDSWFNAIKPYSKTAVIPKCPKDSTDEISYSMNKALDKTSMALLDDPKETVLFYEGKNGVLNFRHQGKAAVCFTDLNVTCKFVTPEESKKLNWKVIKDFAFTPTSKRNVVFSHRGELDESKKIKDLQSTIRTLTAKIKSQSTTISKQAAEISSLKVQLTAIKTPVASQPARAKQPVLGSKAAWSALYTGMTKGQVRSLLGNPRGVRSFMGSSTWEYDRLGSVKFDSNGNVTEWREP